MECSSARLRLRHFRADDGAAIYAYLSHPESVRFEPYDMPTRDECDELARRRAADSRFVAVCLQDGTLIGNLYRAVEEPTSWRTWQIGYVFGPQHWGQGFATEALTLLLRDLFLREGAHRVVAHCDTRNTRSWRLLERIGMRREAHMLQAASFRDGPDGRPCWHDSYQYALLDTEFRL